MPMVTATPVSERDDDEVQHRTYFIGLANTANNSYTYPTTQEVLIVRNRSDTESLTLTVNGSSYTIPKGGSKEIVTSFTTFSIASTSNSQAFDATAIKAVSSKSSGGTGVLVVANLTELQASYPNGALAPVWVTSENSWYYWSGAVPTPDTTPPTVTASLSTGTYVGTQSVNLAANESATIYYTTDGSTPNTGSSVYSSAISVSANTVLKYYGVDTAGNSSAVQTVTYTITQPDTTAPDAPTNFAAGTPTSSTVPLTWTASVASDLSKYEIAYSTDGTNFTVASSNVTGTSATVTGLTANTSYTFRITAIDTSSNRSTTSPTVQVSTAAQSTTKKLAMSGTASASYIQAPSMTFDSIEIDAYFYADNNKFYLDARTGASGNAYFQRDSSGVDVYGSDNFSLLTVNGVTKANLTNGAVPVNARSTVKLTASAAKTDDITFFAHNNKTAAMKVDVYSIKIYNGATLVAHYDMNTETVNDQSGNGRNATQTGGTFV